MFENNQPSVAVLLPCFNEEVTIGKVVRDFKAALPGAAVYVYDNNSTDRTAEIAAAEGAIVRKEPRQGKGNVIRAMFEDIDADVYVMADGDDTYPADAAPAMVAKVLEGYDMVIGDRLSSTYFGLSLFGVGEWVGGGGGAGRVVWGYGYDVVVHRRPATA